MFLLILSIDGVGYVPVEWLKQVGEVAIAFDRDQVSNDMAVRLKQELHHASRQTPAHKDWNEDLRVHLQNLQKHFNHYQHKSEADVQI